MNIVYIIGNGLDIGLGLKTRYLDFYKYYCSLDDGQRNEDVIKLRDSIAKGKEDWKDLEYQLGQYTVNVKDVESMERICLDLSDSLREYLLREQEKVKAEDFDRNCFINNLMHPESFLLPTDSEILYNGMPNISDRSINIITLNYTDTLEKILQLGRKGIAGSGIDPTGIRWNFNNLLHVHGTLSGSPLVGVDNVIQIANKEFAANEDLRELMLKPNANVAIKSGIDNRCRDLIRAANLIVLFGVSLGETDLIWWKEVGARVKKGAKAVILHHDAGLGIEHHENLIARYERRVRSDFVKKASLEGVEKDWRNGVFVTFNRTFLRGVAKSQALL